MTYSKSIAIYFCNHLKLLYKDIQKFCTDTDLYTTDIFIEKRIYGNLFTYY